MDNQRIKCPVPKGNRECGREEILEKKRSLGKNPRSQFIETHHECEEHKFHIQFPGGGWVPCDCME